MIKSTLYKVCSIACYTFSPIFQETYEFHTSKNLPIIHQAIFLIFLLTKDCSEICDLFMQTSDKEQNLVSKLHRVELPS